MQPKPAIYLALLHHPILNRVGEVVATAVTNVDIHDIARSSRTYGIEGVFYVTPVRAQQELVADIMAHWTSGEGAKRNAARAEAFQPCRVADSLDAAVKLIAAEQGMDPRVVVTSARSGAETTSFEAFRGALSRQEAPQLLVFGTGYGLAQSVLDAAHVRLEPVHAAAWAHADRAPYNHLSVRSAVAIILDRIFGAGREPAAVE